MDFNIVKHLEWDSYYLGIAIHQLSESHVPMLIENVFKSSMAALSQMTIQEFEVSIAQVQQRHR